MNSADIAGNLIASGAGFAWASGASDQRIFILRRHRFTVAVANETDYPMDLAALNRVIATATAILT
jgi:hypothetical protein